MIIPLAMFLLLSGTQASLAQVSWPVSIKVFTDGLGTRPSGTTDSHILADFERFNARVAQYGRGFFFETPEIVEMPPSLQFWFNRTARSSSNAMDLWTAVNANQELYQYRPNQINIYVINSSSGICCGGFAAFFNNPINFVGRTSDTSLTILHEIGHYMGLNHPQGMGCNECCSTNAVLSCCDVPGDDLVDDTLEDVACWNKNDIAFHNFQRPYDDPLLPEAQRIAVDRAWENLMSYHNGDAGRLTSGQLDRLAEIANTLRGNVTQNRFVFVHGTEGLDFLNSGTIAASAVRTVPHAISISHEDDVLILNRGTYSISSQTPWVISDNRVLSASRGTVRLTTSNP